MGEGMQMEGEGKGKNLGMLRDGRGRGRTWECLERGEGDGWERNLVMYKERWAEYKVTANHRRPLVLINHTAISNIITA